MKRAYIVHAKRTAIGKLNGKLSSVRVDDLLAHVFTDIKNTIKFDPKLIDDVIVGCANQAGEDNRNVARMAVILAGLPMAVPGTTINRLCGSSLDALIDGAARIQAGMADCLIIGGAESMTRAPYVISKAGEAFGRDQKMFDTTLGWRFPNSKMEKMFPLFTMGETAEEVATMYNISRDEQDAFAMNSHKKAIAAWDRGDFIDEVLPYTIEGKKESVVFSKDECPRADSTMEALGKLKPVFRKDGSVTAGNSSPMNDGASGLLLVSEEFMKAHNLTPMLEVTGAATRGVHPNTMGIGPIEAVKALMKRYSKKISDFDAIELNEAFAAQSLGCIIGLELDQSKVNMNGGAIAIGHALGSSGTRIVTTLAHQMKKNKNLKEGLATMCIGVGQGIAVSFKNCQ
ncbi:MAG: acetyl-CoA C-acyltransferase [Bdellovibrionales bacterium]|nr:acetyl-CoA C-acyltransferase [Bdellovibrionales bacterium]